MKWSDRHSNSQHASLRDSASYRPAHDWMEPLAYMWVHIQAKVVTVHTPATIPTVASNASTVVWYFSSTQNLTQ